MVTGIETQWNWEKLSSDKAMTRWLLARSCPLSRTDGEPWQSRNLGEGQTYDELRETLLDWPLPEGNGGTSSFFEFQLFK